ncbi:MAG: hypothetical protein CMB52_03055 [Euryarchaeota archaeon]|nr:hypothetical protein [Euryarchaeota archaeon]
MSAGSGQRLTPPQAGRVFSILTDDPREPLHWLAMMEHELSLNIVVFSRLSPQRLGKHLKLDRIEFKWLSESMDQHALSPSLERIHHSVSTRISGDCGIIWIDGVEYLIHRQGFDAFLSFTRSLADELSGTNWTVLLPFSPLSLEGTEIAHLRREAVPYNIPTLSSPIVVEAVDDEIEETLPEIDEPKVEEVPKPEENYVGNLKMLSTIAKPSFSPSVLRRRMAQWREMGLDVSELEQVPYLDQDSGYEIYLDVEGRVRRAVECERRIQMLQIRGHHVEAAKMRFRIMQLTGIGDVESRLDELLSGQL